MPDKEEKKPPTKAELEREKLLLENLKLKRETKKGFWLLGKAAQTLVPIATFIVTVFVFCNQIELQKQTQAAQKQAQAIEKRRFESELARQFAATVKDFEENKPRSVRLGAILSMENFIPLGEDYRGRIYLLYGNLLREEAKKEHRDSVLVYHIVESFRKLSKVRLTENDTSISLYLVNAKLDFLDLFSCDFRRANLMGADLRGADLRKVNLIGANLSLTDLRKADLHRANLYKAKLNRANLYEAKLVEANLIEANLIKTDFIRTNLYEANLSGANLGNANLSGADFSFANFDGANLSEADLHQADLRRAKNLTIEQLSKVKTFYRAKLDSSLLEQVKEKYPDLLERPKEE